MTGQVVLRSIEPVDEEFLRALYLDAHPELAQLPLPPTAAAALVDQQRSAQRAQYLSSYPDSVDQLILCDGEPVGRCWTNRTATEVRLLDIAVRGDRRGQGVGSQVLTELCAQADADGVEVRLSVWQANQAALGLYRRFGFSEQDEHHGYLGLVRPAGAAADRTSRTDQTASAHAVDTVGS